MQTIEAASRPARIEMMGVVLDPLSLEESVERVVELVRAGGSHQHMAINAAKVVLANDDPELASTIRECSLVNVDGASVVHAARYLGYQVPERVAGIDLMEALLDRAASEGFSVYFLGARPEVVLETVVREMRRHPGLIVSGYRDGYFGIEKEAEVVAEIAASGADMLFVAMPSPRKEQFLGRNRLQLGVPFLMGVGGSFDVVAGLVRRAPLWVQRAGLEWAYRLGQEPRRMFRRYLVGNTRFLMLLARHWLWSSRPQHSWE